MSQETLSEHIRSIWSDRQHYLSNDCIASLAARSTAAGCVDLEISDAIVTMRELGILPARGEEWVDTDV